MISKKRVHEKAINLRKAGFSYSEILKEVDVSQSTLSLWLKDIKLSQVQQERLNKKQYQGQLKGAFLKRNRRVEAEKIIVKEALADLKGISKRELWLMGIMAYWCEGAKQKDNNVSQPVVFANSDPILLKVFVRWLKEICLVPEDDIVFTLYIHQNANILGAMVYWSKVLNIKVERLGQPILKRHNSKTLRRNTGLEYFGLIRVAVKRSTNLNRKIKGWVLGINKGI